MSKEVDDKIKSIIGKAVRLGWISRMNDTMYINLADVEKLLCGVFDETYLTHADVRDKEAEIIFKNLPEIKPRDYDQLKQDRKVQAEDIGNIINGKHCVIKPECCPFLKKGVEQK